MKIQAFVLCLFVCGGAVAQSVHNGNLQVLGSFDASTGLWSKPMTTVTSDPTGACTNAAAMVINTSTGSQKGDISVCVNSNWQLANNTSLTLTGDVVGTASGGSLAATVQRLNGVPLSNLTGIAKWTSGQPSTATSADVVALFGGGGSCSGSLQSDGTCMNLTLPLSVANGGNGTASPSLSAGANVTITGTWPNYTISSSGGGGGGSGSSAAQFAPAYGSGTVTFGSCSSVAPCYVAPNGILDSFTATPSVSPASGSGADTLWVYAVPGSNTVQVGYNSANTYTCSGCSLTSGVQAIPANSYGLFSCTVTGGQIISGGCNPTSTPYSNSSIGTGLGVAVVRDTNTGKLTLNNDREVRQVKTGSSDNLQASDCGHEVVYAVASAMSVSVPQAGLGSQFIAGCDIWLINKGSGTVTFTPQGSSHFNGATGGQALSGASPSAPTSAYLASDGIDYWGIITGGGGGGGGGGLPTTGGTLTGQLTINTSTGPQLTLADPSNLRASMNVGPIWSINANGSSGVNQKFYIKNGSGLNDIVIDPTTDIVTLTSLATGTAAVGALQVTATSSGPTCAASGDIGKQWINNTTSTTEVEFCVSVGGTIEWQKATLSAP